MNTEVGVAETGAAKERLVFFRNMRVLLMAMRFIIACILGVGAIVLAFYSKEGWWWFLLCSFVLGVDSWTSYEASDIDGEHCERDCDE